MNTSFDVELMVQVDIISSSLDEKLPERLNKLFVVRSERWSDCFFCTIEHFVHGALVDDAHKLIQRFPTILNGTT